MSIKMYCFIFFRAPLVLSFGKLARFADGSCVGSIGSTSALVTTVCPQNSYCCILDTENGRVWKKVTEN